MLLISIIFDAVIWGIVGPIIFIALSNSIDKILQFTRFDFIFLTPIGVFFICIGIVFIVWAYYLLVKVGKGYTVEFFGRAILPVTSHLVTTGPYSRIRHPIAFGYLVILLGLGVIRGSLSGIFIVSPLIFIAVSLYLKFFEEKALCERFKEEYEEYMSRTRFIIPWLRKGGQRCTK